MKRSKGICGDKFISINPSALAMLSAIEDCTLSARAMLARRDVGMLSAVNVKGGDCVWHLSGREDVEDCKRDFVFGRDERLGRGWIHPCGQEDACA